MTRDVAALTAKTVDVLVVGGGIYGLTIACDAAQRGLTVALVERDDFGSGSSFNHLRTIHGGLRYLQRLDIGRSRESIRERRTLARIAPRTLKPLRFVLPLYQSMRRGPLAMRAGFLLDRLVSFDRNESVPPSHQLPAGHVVSRSEAIEWFPGLRRPGLAGAAVWYDYVTIEADRLTFAWALAAADQGAILANYVEATAPLVDRRRVTGIGAIDRVTGRTLEIAARLTVNATGAAVNGLLTPLGLSAGLPLLKAMNLVTTRAAGDDALGGLSRTGRPLFLVPWRGRAVFGTWESRRPVAPAETGVECGEVAEFIDDLNQAFPALDLKAADVSYVHRGLVPAVSGRDGSMALEGREQTRDHAADGVEGLMSVAGTKYTTARAVAERVTDKVVAKLGREARPCRTAVTPLPGSDVRDVMSADEGHRAYDARLPGDTVAHLVAAYGSRVGDVLHASDDQPASLMRLSQASPVIGAELIWAARREMAVTLRDAVIRRTPLGALGHPGDPAALCAAAIMAREHGWSPEQTAAELSSLRSFYLS